MSLGPHESRIDSVYMTTASQRHRDVMQGGLSYGKGVRPSVRLSVTRVNCDKTNESSAEILIPHEGGGFSTPFLFSFFPFSRRFPSLTPFPSVYVFTGQETNRPLFDLPHQRH